MDVEETAHENVDWIYPDQWKVVAEWISEIQNLWHMSLLWPAPWFRHPDDGLQREACGYLPDNCV